MRLRSFVERVRRELMRTWPGTIAEPADIMAIFKLQGLGPLAHREAPAGHRTGRAVNVEVVKSDTVTFVTKRCYVIYSGASTVRLITHCKNLYIREAENVSCINYFSHAEKSF